MNETKRYNEPKILWDILKDMQMDTNNITNNIERKKKIRESSKKYAEETIENLYAYASIVENINPLYTRLNSIFEEVDAFYVQEKSLLQQTKRLIKTWHIDQKKLHENIENIENILIIFTTEQHNINDELRKHIAHFSSSKDKKEHTIKANGFLKLFIQTYSDIYDLCTEYRKLLKQAPRK